VHLDAARRKSSLALTAAQYNFKDFFGLMVIRSLQGQCPLRSMVEHLAMKSPWIWSQCC